MIGQSQIIEKYNNLQGKSLKRSEIRAFIRQAKSINVHEIVNKLAGLLRSFPNEKGFEFTRITPIEITDNFEALGIPYLSPEEEKELGTTEIEGLGKRVSNDDIYKLITDKFIKIIDQHDRMPWSSGFNDVKEKEAGFSFSNLPINYISKKYYRGINSLVLSMYRYHTDETRGKITITDKGFEEGITEMITDDRLFWLTFKQINEVGGKLKKGSLSQQAIYYNWIFLYDNKKISEKKFRQLKKQFGCSNTSTSENCKKLRTVGFLKYYNLFNERDIEGVDFEAKRSKLKLKTKEVKTKEQKILAADLVLKHMPLKPKLEIKFVDKNKNESPYYSPSLDKVVMPQKTQFDSLDQWYGVAFHEHIHATGHAKRTKYAMEELVAEIGSAFLNAESGILLDNLKNNAAYIKGWAKGVRKHLQKDNKAIFVAAGQSQKAADYILDFDKDGDPAYWNEYEKIQKEIKVKGKKQADGKKKKVVSSTEESKKKKLRITNHTFKYFDVAINHTHKLFTIRFKEKEPYPISNYLKNDNFKNTSSLHWQRKIGAWGNPKDRLDILKANMMGIYDRMDQEEKRKKTEIKKKNKETEPNKSIITDATIESLNEEFKYNKTESFLEQLDHMLGRAFDPKLNKKHLKVYVDAIKKFLGQKKLTKLNKKQAIAILEFGTFTVNPLPQNMVKPKKLSFRDATVMMNKEVASRDDLRPVMMHVLHEGNYLVSTDAHALSKIKVKEQEKKENVVYDKAGRKHENIGNYPKYKAVIPQDNDFVSSFNLKELITKIKGIVKAQSCVTENGLHGVIVHDKRKVFFNPAIILRSLTPLYKNGVVKVKLYVGAPNRAIIFKDEIDDNQLALCMPVMGGFEHKIIASIFGDYKDGDRGLKGVKNNSKSDQLALFGLNGTVEKKVISIEKKKNTNKKGLGTMGRKKKYKTKYNQKLINQLKNEYKFGDDFVRKAIKGERNSSSAIQIKNKYNELNTNSDKKIQFQTKKIQISDNGNGSGITGIGANDKISDKKIQISDRKNTNNKTEILPLEKPVNNSLVKSINHISGRNESFNITGDIGSFLGEIEKKPIGSVACTIDAPQGTGKTRFFFQIMNEMAKNYKVLFISLEEHPASTLFKSKVAQYIDPKNQNNIDTIGELARGQEKQILDDLIPHYDVVLVDSWNKIYEAARLDFDNDLRKAYNGKLIFAIFQRTVTGTMRGGAKSQFDGDIIMKIEKGDDFKQNEVYHNKNRYQNKDLNQLRYNIYSQTLSGGLLNAEPVAKLPNQMNQQGAIWEDVTIVI